MLEKPFLLKTENDLICFGERMGEELFFPKIVTLEGCLGAGKTTFAKGVISKITSCSREEIVSPTFQYMHLYQSPMGRVVHFDLWRLSSVEEFLSMGLDEFLFDSIVLIEWPDRIASLLPQDALRIHFSVCDEGRMVSLHSLMV